MKNITKSLRLTLILSVFLALFYVLVLWIFARVIGPNGGLPETTLLTGDEVGAANVGQAFTKDIYFWGRPSSAGAGYDAANSAGSNKGVSHKEYLAQVEERIDTFLIHHPYLQRKDIPAEMVTASGSGLDPDITPSCAYIQAKRIADARGISLEYVNTIIQQNVESPLLGLFGPEKVNVLKLNIALDNPSENKK